MNEKRRLRSRSLLVALLLTLSVAGCASLGPSLRPSDYEAVHRGEKSLVLTGISAAWNDKPADPIKLFTEMTSGPIELAIASLDEGTGLKRTRVFVATPSGKSNRRWLYLLLSPGCYYVWGVPTTLLPRDLKFPLRDAGGFWLEVSSGQPVQYAGTLQFDLRGSQFLMEKFYKRFNISLFDEREAASMFVQAGFGQLGPTEVSLMRRYGEANLTSESPFPTLVTTHATSVLHSPDWKRRAMETALLPSGILAGVGGLGGVVLALAYAPIGIGIGEVLGATDARKWQPCIDGLKEEIEQLVPAAGLREQLGKALGDQAVIYETDQPVIRDPATIAAQHNCQSVLLADIQRIQLRECNRGMFYVEVATRVRLWDARTARYVFDETALYNNPKTTAVPGEIEPPSLGWMLPLPFPQPYEVVLSAASPARELKEYCSADGRKIFAEELDTGVSHAIQHFTRVLRPLTGDNR